MILVNRGQTDSLTSRRVSRPSIENRATIKQTNGGQHRAFMECWSIADADKRKTRVISQRNRGKASCKQAVLVLPRSCHGKGRNRFCACPYRARKSNTSAPPKPPLGPIARAVAHPAWHFTRCER